VDKEKMMIDGVPNSAVKIPARLVVLISGQKFPVENGLVKLANYFPSSF
jgi:hypothetical protein